MSDPSKESWTEGHQQASEPDFYGKWISVNSSDKPEDCACVHISCGDSVYIGLYDSEYKKWRQAGEKGFCNPTHWMSLPEPFEQ